jgi:hypothetical protein
VVEGQLAQLGARQPVKACIVNAFNTAVREVVEAAAVLLKPKLEAADCARVWAVSAAYCHLADGCWNCVPELAAGYCSTGEAALIQLLQHLVQSCCW